MLKGGRVFRPDKNDPLFCGFALAYFFATWGNDDFQRPQRRKSTEKWGIFIMPPTSLGGITTENILTWTAHHSRAHKTPRHARHLGLSSTQFVDKRWGNLSTGTLPVVAAMHRARCHVASISRAARREAIRRSRSARRRIQRLARKRVVTHGRRTVLRLRSRLTRRRPRSA